MVGTVALHLRHPRAGSSGDAFNSSVVYVIVPTVRVRANLTDKTVLSLTMVITVALNLRHREGRGGPLLRIMPSLRLISSPVRLDLGAYSDLDNVV